MKYLDIISDKIDYLFRRGKNAEDRCYDFFIRTVTFLIITLIVLCYGSFVHADGLTLKQYYNINASELTNSNWYLFNDDDNQKFMNELNNTENVEYMSLTGSGVYSSNNPINSVLAIDGFNLSSNYIFVYDSTSTWIEFWLVPKSLIDSGEVVAYVPDGSSSVAFYSSSGFSCPVWSVLYTEVNNASAYDNSYYGTYNVPAGNFDPDSLQGAWGYRIAFSNAPILRSDNMSNQIISNWVSSDFDNDYPNMYDCNYYTYTPDLSDIYDGGNGSEVESNANHNYLNDIQIGLTSQNLRQNILSSQVIIGCDVDDWILNHLDDYSMYINYKIYIKDSYQSSPNDPEFNYSVILPLRTFYNNAYTYSVAELFRNCTNSSNQSFQSYFNIVGEGQRVLSEQPYNAIIPCFLETIYQGLGKYYVAPDPEYQTIPYTIFQFKLDVSCSLTYQGMSVDDASGIYLKEFDFKNGSESVKVADILRNDNPWEGESDPQQSPIVPSAGGSPSGYGGSGGVNVNVDVSGQKIPIGVKTKQEIQIILDNYKEVNDTFMDNWEDLSDPNNDNNFMSFISDETKNLPAVDYMIKGACAIFGLSIILFVLKVLLF